MNPKTGRNNVWGVLVFLTIGLDPASAVAAEACLSEESLNKVVTEVTSAREIGDGNALRSLYTQDAIIQVLTAPELGGKSAIITLDAWIEVFQADDEPDNAPQDELSLMRIEISGDRSTGRLYREIIERDSPDAIPRRLHEIFEFKCNDSKTRIVREGVFIMQLAPPASAD